MADVWSAARRQALSLRARLLATDSHETAGAALDAALTDSGLKATPLSPDDALLSGAHAVLDREMDAIWLRGNLSTPAQRLLIAHELGHHYLHPEYVASADYDGSFDEDADAILTDAPPDGVAEYLVGYGPRQRRESEANVFARELVLPASQARRLFREGGLDAAAIAARVGVPISTVYAQLAAPELRVSDSVPSERAGEEPTLDPSQAAAAHAERGPILVGAGPGTGKTRTLAARVHYLLTERNVPPENILCLTFSRKAAEEMQERIGARTGAEQARRLTVCTFHSFGLDLLRRYWKQAGLPPRPALLTTVEAFALLESRLPHVELTTLRYLHDPTFPLPDVLRLIGRLKEEMVTPTEAARRIPDTDAEKAGDIARLYAAYEQALRENGAIDFADLVCRAVTLLENDPVVRRAEQNRWRHILVDEFQDVNRAGSRLVRALGGETGEGVWCVGDLRQAIYRFRGASPANVARFAEEFPGGRRIDLAVNYRSLPPLVALFGAVSGDGANAWQSSRSASAFASDERQIRLAVAPDDYAQSAGITTEMQRLNASGIAFRDIAVLCRTNAQARALRLSLAGHGIPVAAAAADNALLKSRDVRELLLLLSLASEGAGETAAGDSLSRRLRGTLPESLSGVSDPAEFFARALWGPFGYARTATDHDAVLALLAQARAFVERASLLTASGENPGQAFLRHIRRLARLGDTGVRGGDADESRDEIRVLTVHSAKGLEFPVVFLPNLSAGYFPSRARPSLIADGDAQVLLNGSEMAEDEDEEARLFFVALSRARDTLVLSRAEKYNGRSAKPSPLLDRLADSENLERIEWPARELPAASADPQDTVSHSSEPEEGPLPAHAVERYLRCPRRYYYHTVRGLGDLPRHTAYESFKRAVLSALRAPDPAAALELCWQEQGPAASDPWRAMYHAVAEKIVAHAGAARGEGKPAPFTVQIAGGSITLQPDAVREDGRILERLSFRRTPSGDTGRTPPERFNTLLAAAAPANAEVRVRYLQSGESLPVKPATVSKKAHLAAYEQAIRGIRLRIFPAAPEDTGNCASCDFLLICPDE